MRSEAVGTFLTGKGFSYEAPHEGDAEYVAANYYRTVSGVENLPHCVSNERPPQMHVQEVLIKVSNSRDYHCFAVEIRNRAPQGWIIFKFYSVAEDDLLAGFDGMVAGLLAAWRALFEVGDAK